MMAPGVEDASPKLAPSQQSKQNMQKENMHKRESSMVAESQNMSVRSRGIIQQRVDEHPMISTPVHTTDKLSKYRESRILDGEENLLKEDDGPIRKGQGEDNYMDDMGRDDSAVNQSM